MAILWDAKLVEVEAALLTSGLVDKQIGGAIRDQLATFGPSYDEAFPDGATVLVESAQHTQWRAAVALAAAELEAVVHAVAGVDVSPPSDDERADLNAAEQKAREALDAGGIAQVGRRMLQLALSTQIPNEPDYYVAGFYARFPGPYVRPTVNDFDGKSVSDTYGAREQRLALAMEAATAWLALT